MKIIKKKKKEFRRLCARPKIKAGMSLRLYSRNVKKSNSINNKNEVTKKVKSIYIGLTPKKHKELIKEKYCLIYEFED